jgi:hypothetical protein
MITTLGSQSFFRSFTSACQIALAAIGLLLLSHPTAVAADKPLEPDKSPVAEKAAAPDKSGQKEPIDQKEKGGRGRFVSFKDGVLTIESNSRALVAWSGIGPTTKIFNWDTDAKAYKQLDGAADALRDLKPGTWVVVGDGKAIIRIGARGGNTTGTFISFKDDRLLMLGKDLGESYTKKYGNTLHMQKFRDDVPAYESIDGGDYKPVGTANKVLPSVKEGTIVTVHGEGDDNIVLVQIGVPKTK